MKQSSFPASQHLKSRNLLDKVFGSTTKIYYKGVKCFYLIMPVSEDDSCSQCGMGVSKKMFKSAVKRNRVKRLLREAYRLQKPRLEQWATEKNIVVYLFLSYQYKDLPVLDKLKHTINVIFDKIEAQYKS